MSATETARRGSRLNAASTVLTCLGIFLLFAVPPGVLDLLQLGYSTPTGPALGKVHPGTYLVVLAAIVAALRAGNPLRFFAAEARRFPGAAVLLAASVLLVVYLVKVQRAPFTPVIDTFVLPALLLPLLIDMPQKRRLIECGLHLFLACNAMLGIAEYAGGWHLVPMQIGGVEVTIQMEWRAAGLLGHPLASASTAGMYAIMLAMGFGPSVPASLRAPAIALQLVSLGAFGGRTALAITAMCMAVLLCSRAASLLQGRRFGKRTGAATVLVGLVIGSGAVALTFGGFFDQVLMRFVDDNGSAESRVLIFDVLRQLSWQELWLGPDQDHVASLLHLEGIEIGVESFWLGFLVLCGIWMSGLFFIAFGFFVLDVMRWADPRALVILGFFLVVISTTNSLAAKTTSLAQFVTLVTILMPVQAWSLRSWDARQKVQLRRA